jgi:gamma-carbonic anhydrase
MEGQFFSMNSIAYKGKTPTIGQNCYIAPTAVLTGDVTIEDGASVWFGCVLRGDVAPIRVGKRSNIQDNTVIHGEQGSPTIIGDDVTVGHSAIVHAAIVADRVLVGMGAVLLSRCRIGPDTIIGARALVTEEVEIPSNSLAIGMPARVRRHLTTEEHEHIMESARHYMEYATQYLAGSD